MELKKIDHDKSTDSLSDRSSLDAGVEESVDVNDVLEETPFLLGVGLNGGVHLGVSFDLHSLDFSGGEGNDSSNNDFLEHFV